MKTERHNLLELIGRSQNTYHSAILTCYTFDPIFFNSFFMPHFGLNRINNVIVFLDSTNYDRLLNDYPSFGLTSDSIKYTLIRQPSSSTGHRYFRMKTKRDYLDVFISSQKTTMQIDSYDTGCYCRVWTLHPMKKYGVCSAPLKTTTDIFIYSKKNSFKWMTTMPHGFRQAND